MKKTAKSRVYQFIGRDQQGQTQLAEDVTFEDYDPRRCALSYGASLSEDMGLDISVYTVRGDLVQVFPVSRPKVSAGMKRCKECRGLASHKMDCSERR